MSRPNDNGRFFEYLVTRELVEKFNLKLTERAEADQIRDDLEAKGILLDDSSDGTTWKKS